MKHVPVLTTLIVRVILPTRRTGYRPEILGDVVRETVQNEFLMFLRQAINLRELFEDILFVGIVLDSIYPLGLLEMVHYRTIHIPKIKTCRFSRR